MGSLTRDSRASWKSAAGSTFAITTTITVRGNYTAEILVNGAQGKRTVDEQGTVQVTDGVLIDTMTKYCKTNLAPPIITRGHIVRLDAHELVVNWEPSHKISTNAVVFRRLVSQDDRPGKADAGFDVTLLS